MADRRRAGFLVLLVFLAGALPLVAPPFDLGALRFAGVSLLWWYIGAVAPLGAVLTTVIALRSPGGADGDGEVAAHGAAPGNAVGRAAPADGVCAATTSPPVP